MQKKSYKTQETPYVWKKIHSVSHDGYLSISQESKDELFVDSSLKNISIKTHNKYSLMIKRIIDLIGGVVALLIFAPFMIACAIKIKVLTDGNIMFTQDRVGLNGKIFKMYKFTTMVKDAQKQDEDTASEGTNVCKRNSSDPRITELGKFMRKYSLDELPQLINILKGDMSLVGPRPYAYYEFKLLDEPQKKIKTAMKPGLTCLVQIKGRTTITDYTERAILDLEYINNWSPLYDVKLLFQTIPVVFKGSGAS